MNDQKHYWDNLAPLPLDSSVIDPLDHRGRKNGYLAAARNQAILRRLLTTPSNGVVLDLGCGTGSLSAALARSGHQIIGLDISQGLLQRTSERRLDNQAIFVLYDGQRFPMADNSVAAITTYVVLTHVLENSALQKILEECSRVLIDDGTMVFIEQARRRAKVDGDAWKFQRTLNQWKQAIASVGLELVQYDVIRFGRFPTTPLIRYGVISDKLFSCIAKLERTLGAVYGIPAFDYCDVLLQIKKKVL